MFKKLLAGMFKSELDAVSQKYEQEIKQLKQQQDERISQLQQDLQIARQQSNEQLQSLQQQIQPLEQERQNLLNQLQEAKLSLQSSDQTQALETLQAESRRLQAELQASQQETAQLELQRQTLEQTQVQLQEQLNGLQGQVEQLESEKTRLHLRLQNQSTEQAEHADHEIKQLKKELEQSQEGFRQQIGVLEQRVFDLTRQNTDLQEQLQAAQQTVQPQSLATPTSPPVSAELISPPAREVKKVLIVDDAATTRVLQKNMLESAGYEVVMGHDGKQGQAMIPEHLPNLVITDIEMPLMDGFALTEWIKTSPYREVPVLLVTSHSDSSFREKGEKVGANGFVEKKSFNKKTFLEIIEKYL